MVRKIDKLGRIVIPKEICRSLGIVAGDSIEIAEDGEYIRLWKRAKVETGEWKYDPDGTDWGLGAWRCSLCGCKNDNLGMDDKISPYLYAGSKYCPHCGARMEAKK